MINNRDSVINEFLPKIRTFRSSIVTNCECTETKGLIGE